MQNHTAMVTANPKLNGGLRRRVAPNPASRRRYLSPETPATRIGIPDHSPSIFCSRWPRPLPKRFTNEKLTITQCLSRARVLVIITVFKRLNAGMVIPWPGSKQITFKNSAFITVLSVASDCTSICKCPLKGDFAARSRFAPSLPGRFRKGNKWQNSLFINVSGPSGLGSLADRNISERNQSESILRRPISPSRWSCYSGWT
jgi:hypothetical protein